MNRYVRIALIILGISAALSACQQRPEEDFTKTAKGDIVLKESLSETQQESVANEEEDADEE